MNDMTGVVLPVIHYLRGGFEVKIEVEFSEFVVVGAPYARPQQADDYIDWDVVSPAFPNSDDATGAARRWLEHEYERQLAASAVEIRFAVLGYSRELEGWRVFVTGYCGPAMINGHQSGNARIVLGRGTDKI